jgi:hypothetical protein
LWMYFAIQPVTTVSAFDWIGTKMESNASVDARVIFVHHSVGRYMIQHGDMRRFLMAKNVAFWDCDYNKIGAHDQTGRRVEVPEVPDDNTDPDGFLRIFTRGSDGDARFIEWLQGFDVVALKSCYPASNISSDEELESRKELYRSLSHSVSECLPSTVLVTPPPLVPMRTSSSNAARSCRLAKWLTTDLALPSNVTIFDLHGLLAHPNNRGDGSLARPYRRLLPVDSHPNTVGARAAGRALAEYLVQTALRRPSVDGGRD